MSWQISITQDSAPGDEVSDMGQEDCYGHKKCPLKSMDLIGKNSADMRDELVYLMKKMPQNLRSPAKAGISAVDDSRGVMQRAKDDFSIFVSKKMVPDHEGSASLVNRGIELHGPSRFTVKRDLVRHMLDEARSVEKHPAGIYDAADQQVIDMPYKPSFPTQKKAVYNKKSEDLARQTGELTEQSRSITKERVIDPKRNLSTLGNARPSKNLEIDGIATKERYWVVDRSPDLTQPMKHVCEDSRSPSKKRDLDEDCTGDLTRDSPQISGSPSKKQKSASQAAEERYFYRIIQNVLDGVAQENHLSDKQIEDAISSIIQSFYYHLGNNFSEIDLERSDNICGYLFRLATLDAGLVRFRTLQAIQGCRDLDQVLGQTELRVVSLGGGPGNDILGFLSALHEARQPRECHLELSIVDAVGNWECCVDILQDLMHNGDFGSVSEICQQNEVDITFHETILPCYRSDSCYEALRCADIILISRLISILDWPQKRNVMQNVYRVTKDSSLVLYVDSPFYDDMFAYYDILYQSEKNDSYELLEPNNRFNHREGSSSKAGIAVLRKKTDR